MHVGLNLIFLTPGESGGMETYVRGLLPALAARGDLRLTAFVSRAAQGQGPWSEVAEQVVVSVDARRRIDWVRGEQRHLPGLAARAGVDVLHSLASTAPLHGPTPRVTTIHDLLYRIVPAAHFGARGLGMRALVPLAAWRSDRVIAVSQSTRDDIVEHLRLPATKVDVVLEAADSFRPAEPTPEATLRERFDLGDRPVCLSASAKRPHKNLARLLHALAGVAPERRTALIVPGYPTPHEDELRRLAVNLGVSDDVRMPGWLPDSDLEGLYRLARAVVFPSLYEGFGLPVLEAMRRGVPVACSGTSSLPEVAGNAALYFDPTDVGEIAAAIERLTHDESLREHLAAAGREQAGRFTWKATAEGTVAAYRRALARRR